MKINITVLVQIAHFLMAYGIVTRLLLKPALKIYNQERAEREQLLHNLAKEQEKVENRREYKRKRWLACQRYFYDHRPTVYEKERQYVATNLTISSVPKLTVKEKEKLIREVAAMVKEKVFAA